MITDLWIENFKGIGKRQHIPLRPITLLFGANSAGKSTVLHALLAFREIVTNRNFSLHDTISGEHTISLGGIEQVLHRTAGSRADMMTLAVAFNVPEACRNSFDNETRERFSTALIASHNMQGYTTLGSDPELVPYAPNPPKSCKIEISVRQSHLTSKPVVSLFALWADHEEFVRFECEKSEDACGWVSLISGSWSEPALLIENQETISDDRTSSVICYQDLCDQVKLLIEGELAREGHRSVRANTVRFATNLLAYPVFAERSGRHVEFPFGAFQTSGTWQSFVPITEYLSEIYSNLPGDILHSTSGEIEKLKNLQGSHSLFVLAYRHSRSASLLRSMCPLAIIGEEITLETLKEAVGVVRHYWTLRYAAHPCEFQGPWTHEFKMNFDGSALPSPLSPLIPAPMSDLVPDFIYDYGDPRGRVFFDMVDYTVPQIVQFAVSQLSENLRSMTYVGPKRSTVPRHLSDRSGRALFDWGNGLAAWQWLVQAKTEAFEDASVWLRRFSDSVVNQRPSGYELIRERFREIPEEDIDRLSSGTAIPDFSNLPVHVRLFLSHRASGQKLQPQDVGEGMTQVVPVIAALVRASHESRTIESNLVAIEQPELHLHPSLAAKLGDLFISTMFTERSARALIKTHSEHLILRILRRIRQTTDGELPEHIPPVKPDDVCVLWVDNLGDGTTFTRLRISDNGRWLDRWPDGFFSERHEELFE